MRACFLGWLFPLVLTACVAAPVTSDPSCIAAPGALSPEPTAFVAMPADFAGYTAWPSLALGATTTEATGGAHDGPATVYISARPAPDAVAFPVGTRIVKVLGGADVRVFAMAKRGGDYNASGAVGWEWFELLPADCVPYFIWRGAGPPSGETYGATDASCNACHSGAGVFDHVRARGLWPEGK